MLKGVKQLPFCPSSLATRLSLTEIIRWKDYLSGAPPSVGAERTENFEISLPLRQPEMAFSGLSSRYFELSFAIKCQLQ